MKIVIRVVQVLLCLTLAALLVLGGWLFLEKTVRQAAAPALFGRMLYTQPEDDAALALHRGDLVLVQPAADYAPGDTVLLSAGTGPALRVLAGTVGDQFIVRTPATGEEELMDSTAFLGKPEAIHAGAGSALGFLASIPGLIVVLVLLLLVLVLPALLRPRRGYAPARHRR